MISEIKWKLVNDTYFLETTSCYLKNDDWMIYVGGDKAIEILIDDMNMLVKKGCAIWLELSEYDFALDRLSKCKPSVWYNIKNHLESLESHGVVLKESKKSLKEPTDDPTFWINHIGDTALMEDEHSKWYVKDVKINKSHKFLSEVIFVDLKDNKEFSVSISENIPVLKWI